MALEVKTNDSGAPEENIPEVCALEVKKIAYKFSSSAPLPTRFGPPKGPSVDASSERAF